MKKILLVLLFAVVTTLTIVKSCETPHREEVPQVDISTSPSRAHFLEGSRDDRKPLLDNSDMEEGSGSITRGVQPLRDLPTIQPVPGSETSPVPPGYHREIIEWTDGGYDSTWTTKQPYQPKETHRIELRSERAGYRLEDVPDAPPVTVLVFLADNRTRFPHWTYRSFYRKHADGWHYITSLDRRVGAVNSYRLYPSLTEEVMMQTTHPYPHETGLVPWITP